MGNFFGLMKKPKEPSKEPSLFLDLKYGSSCDYHRVTLPLKEVEAQFHPRKDIFVFNRICSGGFFEVADMKKQGFKIVVDWDDFIDLEPDHYLYKSFQKRNFREEALSFLQLADVVTVTTEYLAYKLRPYHKNIVVIRNALPFDTMQFTKSNDKTSSTPLIWAGGASHEKDLSIISGAIDSKLLTIAGYEDYPEVIPGSYQDISSKEWRKIRDNFMDSNLTPAIKDLNKYMETYNGHAVALAPLVNNYFNRCKSNLKVLEAGAKGLPIICSKVLPYYNPIDDSVVSYADAPWEWNAEVKKYLRNPAYREDRGEALAEHVRKHYNIEQANELRRQVYESL